MREVIENESLILNDFLKDEYSFAMCGYDHAFDYSDEEIYYCINHIRGILNEPLNFKIPFFEKIYNDCLNNLLEKYNYLIESNGITENDLKEELQDDYIEYNVTILDNIKEKYKKTILENNEKLEQRELVNFIKY